MALSELNTDTHYWKTFKFFLIFILCNFAASKSFAQVYSFQTREFFENAKEQTQSKYYTSCADINGISWEVGTDGEINNTDFLKAGTASKGASYIVLKPTFSKSQIRRVIVIAGTNKKAKSSLISEIRINNQRIAPTKRKDNDNIIHFLFNDISKCSEGIEIKVFFDRDTKNYIVIREIEIVNEINEKEDNSTAITNNKGIKDNSIQINRTLSKDYWNTFCLPFDVNEESVKLLLNNPELKDFSGKIDGTTMKFRDAKEIKAGIPYIIKPAKDVVNPIFRNVIVTATEPKIITDNQLKNYSFIGTYSPTELKIDGTELFLGDKDYLYKPFANDKTINGMRAFFRIKNNTSQARQSQYNIAIDETTFISLPNISITPPSTQEKIYTLDGRQVRSTHNLKAGIYIKNGKKLYVR
ncbi:conserved hypothetical protein [Prevotella intermedia]|uniref:Uncharacterized protein n=1 Tax=Prevotella intermedia TaxID=28131 RepID=A0A0S3UHB8_PREIN|nr:hypothetical protein [Prevotella intermedia]BAU16921.1 conserved hypothetical protein [Prevotella intermedia]